MTGIDLTVGIAVLCFVILAPFVLFKVILPWAERRNNPGREEEQNDAS